MPITQAQRERRIGKIGSSDTPPILGCDPWRTAADVYYNKVTDGVPEEDGDSSSPAAEVGNILENALIEHASKIIELRVIRNQYRVHANGIHAANCDALVTSAPEVVEIKTTGLMAPIPEEEREQWGEAGSGDVPLRVVAQVQHQMACCGPEYRVGHVIAWVGHRGIVHYRIERHDPLIELLIQRGEAFWRDHVIPRKPPTEAPPKLDLLKRLIREPGKTIDLAETDMETVNAWLSSVEECRVQDSVARALAKRKDLALARMLHLLGDAETGRLPNGCAVRVTRTPRKGYTVEASETVRLKFLEALEEEKGDKA